MARGIKSNIFAGILAVVAVAASAAPAGATIQMGGRGGTDDMDGSDPSAMVSGRQRVSDTARVLRERQVAAQQNAARRAAKAVPAVEADLTVGAPIFDLADQELGRISSVSPQGVDLTVRNGTIAIAASDLFKYRKQLLIKTSKAEFDAKIAAALR